MELSLPYPSTAAIALLAFLFALYFSLWRSKSNNSPKVGAPRSRLPAEAGGAWPIIGHLHLLGSSQLAHRTLGAMADKYGPVFTIRLGVRRAVVISSLELAKELFSTHDIALSSRPNYLAAKHLTYDYAMFAFSPYGAYWREMRKLISVELLSTHRLELLKNVRISETDMSMKELYKFWNENKRASTSSSSSGYALAEMKQRFADLTFNVILKMVAGKRYFGEINVSEEKEARRCQRVIRDFFHLTGLFVVGDFIPWLNWLDLGGYVKKMKETAKEMDQIVEGWLKEHRVKRELGEADEVDRDFMDVMLSLTEGAAAEGYDADTISKATCMNLILGGSDTTSVMLTWALSLLLNHPQVLKKAQEELDLQVGKHRRVTESDIPNLVYLDAIVKETLRLYPAAPLGTTRDFIQDCTIGGNYHIPKGTRLIFNTWKLHRDPNIWPNDPSEFRPERFLTTHKTIDVKGQQFELIPFGVGRRICPGLQFALQILHLVLANVLHAFEISTPGNEPVDLTESAGLTNLKATPLEVLIAPRLPLDLY